MIKIIKAISIALLTSYLMLTISLFFVFQSLPTFFNELENKNETKVQSAEQKLAERQAMERLRDQAARTDSLSIKPFETNQDKGNKLGGQLGDFQKAFDQTFSDENLEKLEDVLDAHVFFREFEKQYPNYTPCHSVCRVRRMANDPDHQQIMEMMQSYDFESMKEILPEKVDKIFENSPFAIFYVTMLDMREFMDSELLDIMADAKNNRDAGQNMKNALRAPVVFSRYVRKIVKVKEDGKFDLQIDNSFKRVMEFGRMTTQCTMEPKLADEIKMSCSELILGSMD